MKRNLLFLGVAFVMLAASCSRSHTCPTYLKDTNKIKAVQKV